MKDVQCISEFGGENAIDICGIGKYGKFINVERFQNEDGTKEKYTNEGIFFKTNFLECDKLSLEQRKNALQSIISALYRYVDAELEEKKIEIKFELEKKHRIPELLKALHRMKNETK